MAVRAIVYRQEAFFPVSGAELPPGLWVFPGERPGDRIGEWDSARPARTDGPAVVAAGRIAGQGADSGGDPCGAVLGIPELAVRGSRRHKRVGGHEGFVAADREAYLARRATVKWSMRLPVSAIAETVSVDSRPERAGSTSTETNE